MTGIESGLNLDMVMLDGEGKALDTSKFKSKMTCVVWGWEGYEEANY